MSDILKWARFLASFRWLGVGILLSAIGLIYITDTERLLSAWTEPLDYTLSRWGISPVFFGVFTFAFGSAWISCSLFFSLTDLRKSHFTGLYKSSLTYSAGDVERVFKDELGLDLRSDTAIEQLPFASYNDRIMACMARLDEKMNSTLKLGKRQPARFYQDFNASGFTTQIELFMTFEPIPRSRHSFEFKGFGIIEDQHQSGRTSRCALVVPETAMSASHNVFRINGLKDRFELLKRGKLVSIEMHQLIDPFNKFPDYLILLKFRVQRRIGGWHISEGLYFVWDSSVLRFLPSGCTANLSVVR